MAQVPLTKLRSWDVIASNERKGRITMRIPFYVVEEDLTVKVPLVWDYDDLKLLENLEGLVETVKGKRVLEIGGGNGYLAYYLSRFTRRYDVYETFPPYVMVYTVYIQPHAVRERLPLNYIVKYLTDEDLDALDSYDIGIYSGLSDAEHILAMLRKKCDKVIHIRSEWMGYKKRLVWEEVSK